MNFEGKVVLVTGAGRGIGAGIAKAFAARGGTVVLTSTDGRSAKEAANAISAEVGSSNLSALAADMAHPNEVQKMIDDVQSAYGRLDILVNNAAVPSLQKFTEITLEEWERVIQVNLTGVMLASQAAAKVMIEHGAGRIINIASTVGLAALETRTAYGSAKAAVIHMTKHAAVELAPFGVTVNAIAPGVIETDMTRDNHTPAMRAAFESKVPIGRYGESLEIAEAVCYFASPNSGYTTGQTLAIDGGMISALAYGGTGS